MGEAITAKAAECIIKTIPALLAEKGSQAVEGTRLRTIPQWNDKHEQAWAHAHASCITGLGMTKLINSCTLCRPYGRGIEHDVLIARATTTLRSFALALRDGNVAQFLADTGA